ncbi:MAG: ATP-binding cassette domain-containing protein [Bacteroidetes bacterium]|nr:ATP-binding cassette domain-containing protein [Bacteroidota bacterium]
MSEEILKALMHLFGIISKQDEGASISHRRFVESFLKFQLTRDKVEEYLALYEGHSGYIKPTEEPIVSEEKTTEPAAEPIKKRRRTSMKDAVLLLSICKQINQTLTQKQKIVVVVRLLELIKADNQFTVQRMELIDTVCMVFNISSDELKIIHSFCINENPYTLESDDILVIDSEPVVVMDKEKGIKHIFSEGLDKEISILRVRSVDLYFVKYNGKSEIFLNGLTFNNKNIYLFAPGSTMRLPQGAVFYSDVVARFLSDKISVKLSFTAQNLEYKFPNGKVGLQDINISEKHGRLIALMGASGAGKTTLLNVLSGLETPSKGDVLINGIDLHKHPEKLDGIVGYIAQDDLLIEELTVFQNLYYNAKLCFKNLTDSETTALVHKTLSNLGLYEIRDIKVGNPLNKKISGGQRKRLNIALELIREPAVLFVDEPTSGLSSRDSENVMDLLKELSLKGKLIFVVIHQPSSDIYKMFDKLILLDTGGFPIYYKNPIEALVYFKTESNHLNAEQGECPTCGNVNPELLFNIIESRVIDDFGQFTNERKVKPTEWYERFKQNFIFKPVRAEKKLPESSFQIPSKLTQLLIFIKRDVLAKVSNMQYMLINLLEAPLLAFILSFIIKYISNPNSNVYIFRENENIPAYIFMCIIVSLFIGLTVSAEEIYRDRKILKRESLLNLSRTSYLFSKVFVLFTLSAIQSLLFVLVGNSIVEVNSQFWSYWGILFSVSCFANMLGLNISSSFNSAVTIYILIPLLIIPQMILGGAMFSFEKLNRKIGGGYSVPVIAEFMTARWAYEGLIVNQFKNNPYQKYFYDIEKQESFANYKQSLHLPELKLINDENKRLLKDKNDSTLQILKNNLEILKNEISWEEKINPRVKFGKLELLTLDKYDEASADEVNAYIDANIAFYGELFNAITAKKDELTNTLTSTKQNSQLMQKAYNSYYNENLSDIVKRTLEKNKIARSNGHLIQLIDPIYQEPTHVKLFDFKQPFYAPKKLFFGVSIETIVFNAIMIWLFTVVLYITLYFDAIKLLLNFFSKLLPNKE